MTLASGVGLLGPELILYVFLITMSNTAVSLQLV